MTDANSVRARIEDNSIPEPNSGCWLWTAAMGTNGYGYLRIDGRTQSAHRVTFEAFKGSIGSNLCVCHSCDNRACVNPDHLFSGTHGDNVADKMRKGRHPRTRTPGKKGASNAHAKLSEDDALKIIHAVLVRAQKCIDVAAEFGVSDGQVSEICSGKAWAHLPRPSWLPAKGRAALRAALRKADPTESGTSDLEI